VAKLRNGGKWEGKAQGVKHLQEILAKGTESTPPERNSVSCRTEGKSLKGEFSLVDNIAVYEKQRKRRSEERKEKRGATVGKVWGREAEQGSFLAGAKNRKEQNAWVQTPMVVLLEMLSQHPVKENRKNIYGKQPHNRVTQSLSKRRFERKSSMTDPREREGLPNGGRPKRDFMTWFHEAGNRGERTFG